MPALLQTLYAIRWFAAAAVLLLTSFLGCSSEPAPDGDSGLRLVINGLPGTAKQLRFTGRLDGRRLLPADQPYSQNTIRVDLPTSTGALNLWVGARNAEGCIVASGSVSTDLSTAYAASDPLAISLFPTLIAPGLCCRPGMICAVELGLPQLGRPNWESIWGRNLGDVWIVGESATVVRIKDGQVQLVSSKQATLTLTAVVGNSDSIWYGAGNGTLLKGPGVASTTTDAMPGTVRSMNVDRSGNPWALSDGCGLMRWTGGSWQKETLTSCSDLSLRGLWESPDTDLWLVAENRNTGDGYVYSRRGGTWSSPVPKEQVKALSGTEGGALWLVSPGSIYRYNGTLQPSPWQAMPLPSTISALWTISAVAEDEVWAAGGCRQLVEGGVGGFRLGPDIPAECKSAYNAIWTHAGELWLVGRSEESGATTGMVWRRFP